MKTKFSKSWLRSKQTRKQRKYRYNAPIHIKRKFLGANLSKDLRKKHNKRTLVVRKGDKVKVMRGSFKGKDGEISKVDVKKTKVYIEQIKRKKVSGTEVQVPFDPSNLQIIELNLDDEKRIASLRRGKEEEKEDTKKKK